MTIKSLRVSFVCMLLLASCGKKSADHSALNDIQPDPNSNQSLVGSTLEITSDLMVPGGDTYSQALSSRGRDTCQAWASAFQTAFGNRKIPAGGKYTIFAVDWEAWVLRFDDVYLRLMDQETGKPAGFEIRAIVSLEASRQGRKPLTDPAKLATVSQYLRRCDFINITRSKN